MLAHPEIRTTPQCTGTVRSRCAAAQHSALARTRGAEARGGAVSDTENAPQLCISRSATARVRS